MRMRRLLFTAVYALVGGLTAFAIIEIFGLNSYAAIPFSLLWLALIDRVGQGFGVPPLLRRNEKGSPPREASGPSRLNASADSLGDGSAGGERTSES